jgi:antiviral helicase SKI2
VQLKGRVACEISTCDELIVAELLFENSLSSLEPPEIVALLSCMVFQEKVDVDPTLSEELQKGVDEIKRVASVIAHTQQDCGMDTPVDEYVRGLKFGLVEVVHAWASGVPFADITELTDVLEGSIVRCIVRLDETCRDVRNAARVIGDPVLYQKMVDASDLIKRDIVFAASLYTK